jgi:hypothetical protein
MKARPSALAEALSEANLPTINLYETMICVDPGFYVLLPAKLRDEILAALIELPAK